MEDLVQEVVDILGDQFSKLQIKEALFEGQDDVDSAIEILLAKQSKNRFRTNKEDCRCKASLTFQ